MKKFLTIGLVLTLLLSLAVMAEMTADQLIAKHLAAIGGEANLRAMKTVMMSGSMFTQGMTLTMKIYSQMPDKGYMEVSMNDMVLQSGGTNGQDAWQKSPQGTFYLTGEPKEKAMRQTDIFPLLDFKKHGAAVKYLGEELVKGQKAYKLEFVHPGNDTTVYFFDAETFYMVKEKDAMSTTTFSDYRKTGKLVFPYKLSGSSEQGQVMITFDTMMVDAPVPESLFVMPKDAQPMPEMEIMGAPEDTTGK